MGETKDKFPVKVKTSRFNYAIKKKEFIHAQLK